MVKYMNQRNHSFDIMRVLACIMIICMHAPLPTSNANGILLSTISYFTAPGLCLFFVISGALLLPIKDNTQTFLRKRLGKVIMPTIVFTITYICLNIFVTKDVKSTGKLLKTICSIPFSAQGHEVLWFMYTLLGLYFVSPIISKWLEQCGKKELEFYLILWAITLCYPILKLFITINEGITGPLYYFSGYVGYYILGHYLNKYPEAITIRKMIIPTLIAIGAPVLCKLLNFNIDFYSLFWYLSIFVAILCITIFTFINKIKIDPRTKLYSFIQLTSNLSFGIYLIHIAIMRFVIWKLDFIININNYLIQWLVIACITLLSSWITTYLISLLPFGDYIIGFKKKKTNNDSK